MTDNDREIALERAIERAILKSGPLIGELRQKGFNNRANAFSRVFIELDKTVNGQNGGFVVVDTRMQLYEVLGYVEDALILLESPDAENIKAAILRLKKARRIV